MKKYKKIFGLFKLTSPYTIGFRFNKMMMIEFSYTRVEAPFCQGVVNSEEFF